MQNDILEMLNGEIERLIEHLGNLTPGTQDYTLTATALDNLYDRRVREIQSQAKVNESEVKAKEAEVKVKEAELKERTFAYQEEKDNNDTLLRQQELDLQEREMTLKEKVFEHQKAKDNNDALLAQKEIDENKKGRFIGYVIDVAKLAVELGVVIYWTKTGLQFEKTGSFTSRSFAESRGNLFKIISKK